MTRAVDEAAFREALSTVPSGVAIVTAVDRTGPKGLTTRSLVTVEADPPLLVISVDRGSRTLLAIRESGAFVANFLQAGREGLSSLFATKADDKFARVRWEASPVAKGAPILPDDSVAYAECVVTLDVAAGDHFLIVGQVAGGRIVGGRPLVYHHRGYTELAP